MSDRFVSCIGMALLCITMALILKNLGAKSVPVLISVASVGMISLFSEGISDLFSTITGLAEYSDISDYLKGALKIIGVGYVGGICSDICLELGEAGLSRAVSLAGRLEIFAITAPFIVSIIEYAIQCAEG